MKLVLATNNPGKVREFWRMLSPLGFDVIAQKELGLALDPEETGKTFAENARIKAAALVKATGLPALADDSGLCVDALNGAPGIYSARYSGGGDEENIKKLLAALDGLPAEKRTARFACALCCLWPDGFCLTATGHCEGKIDTKKQGDGGFGYDPVFCSDAVGSFGLATPEEKDAVSHRGAALREFVRLWNALPAAEKQKRGTIQ